MSIRTRINRTFTLQHDQADCGISCLLSIVRYYGGDIQRETLRKQSGTTISGTTLLGLYQAATNNGFLTTAYECDIEKLKEIKGPSILHVIIDKYLKHYVVCYGWDSTGNSKQGKFLIGDPSKGIIEVSENELESVWESKSLLSLYPEEQFLTVKQDNKVKLRWFWKLLKDDADILSITMILGLIITVLGLATAVFTQKLIDEILPSGNATKLTISLIILFLITIIGAGISYVRKHFLLKQGRSFNIRLLNSFFDTIVHLPKAFFDNRKIGDMITRMNDTSKIQRNLAYISGTFFVDIILLIVTSLFLINYSILIAVITFCFMPFIVLLVVWYSKPIKEKQLKMMIYSSLNESNYIDTIQGISVIKDNNKQEQYTLKTKGINYELQSKILDLGKTGNNFSLNMDILGAIITLTLFAVSCFMVFNKQLLVGEMIAVIALAGRLTPAISRLTQINIQIQEARLAFDRMYEFTSLSPEFIVEDKIYPPLVFDSLEVDHISFRFPGHKTILSDVSFSIKKGEIIALLGESGCGKSTTLQLLQKYYTNEHGSIKINGIPLTEIYTPSWRNCISTVPQDAKIFNGNVIYNITMSYDEDEIKKGIKFCAELGIENFINALPQSYFTLIGEEGINLSGGQKQIIALTRALFRNPQLLLLDEATSAMDRNTERIILEILQRKKNQISILMITHKPQTAKIADFIYIIDDGMIQDKGSPTNLLKRDNLFSQMSYDMVLDKEL